MENLKLLLTIRYTKSVSHISKTLRIFNMIKQILLKNVSYHRTQRTIHSNPIYLSAQHIVKTEFHRNSDKFQRQSQKLVEEDKWLWYKVSAHILTVSLNKTNVERLLISKHTNLLLESKRQFCIKGSKSKQIFYVKTE